jgi:hypothetical protein
MYYFYVSLFSIYWAHKVHLGTKTHIFRNLYCLKVTGICCGTIHMCDGGVMVSIVAFQAVDPSSILGHRIVLLF